jgi:hypothetical protein
MLEERGSVGFYDCDGRMKILFAIPPVARIPQRHWKGVVEVIARCVTRLSAKIGVPGSFSWGSRSLANGFFFVNRGAEFN